MTDADWESFIRQGVTLPQAKQAVVLAALRVSRGNRKLAARRLGIPVRTLRATLARYRRVNVVIPPVCSEGLN